MFEKLRVVFTIPELRRKVFLTLMLLAIYRVGYQVTLPGISLQKTKDNISQTSDTFQALMKKVAVFSASDLRRATIFGLGIMPYISASIIFQLLGTVWKPIEDLRKEGETGRKKINEYTRYLTVVLCLVQSWMYVRFSIMQVDGDGNALWLSSSEVFTGGMGSGTVLLLRWQITMVLTMTCGTVFLMWLGEQIDEYGIGNGISLLIMAGILAQMPEALRSQWDKTEPGLRGLGTGEHGIESIIVLLLLFVAVVAGVVFITLGQRRIPTQSAKHVRGRRVYGGTKQFLPLKINQAGVMPIIFASSLLMLPTIVLQPLSDAFRGSSGGWILNWLLNAFGRPTSLSYNLLYVGMIYFFCYFWTAITFNPKEIAENLKDFGTFIPGYRPGRMTANYLEKVMLRITYVGAGFLALVAIVPTIIAELMHIDFSVASFYGGTGLLIAVSVAFDLVQKIDNHLLMRNYPGLLE